MKERLLMIACQLYLLAGFWATNDSNSTALSCFKNVAQSAAKAGTLLPQYQRQALSFGGRLFKRGNNTCWCIFFFFILLHFFFKIIAQHAFIIYTWNKIIIQVECVGLTRVGTSATQLRMMILRYGDDWTVLHLS